MRVFILDDDEKRHEGFRERYAGHALTHCYTAQEAIQTLMLEPAFDVVQLDHDLGGRVYCKSDEESGYAVAQAIVNMAGGKYPGKVAIHSWNNEASYRMMRLFVEKDLPVFYEPFGCWLRGYPWNGDSFDGGLLITAWPQGENDVAEDA